MLHQKMLTTFTILFNIKALHLSSQMQEMLLIVTVTFTAIKALIKYPASFHLDLPTAVKC